MTTLKKPTAAQFKTLLLDCIDNSGYSDAELTTDQAKLQFACDTIRSELPHLMRDNRITVNQCQDWLQGLASACTIPFMNADIVQWWCECTGIDYASISDRHFDQAVELYWQTAASKLHVMLSRVQDGYKA